MKSLVYFILFAAINVAICDMCSQPGHEVCNVEQTFPKDFPETVEEMTQNCMAIRDGAKCLINYFETCNSNEEEGVQSVLTYMQDKCQEDTPEFQAISSKLDCFTPAIRSSEKECSYFGGEEFMDIYLQARNVSEESGILECFNSLFMITCKSGIVGNRCGAELKDVVSDIYKHVQPGYIVNCNTEAVAQLTPLMENIELFIRNSSSNSN